MRAALLDAFQDFVPKADPSNKGEKNSLPQRRLARCTNFLCALICLCALCMPQKFSAPLMLRRLLQCSAFILPKCKEHKEVYMMVDDMCVQCILEKERSQLDFSAHGHFIFYVISQT
jgi:hypothetical protein